MTYLHLFIIALVILLANGLLYFKLQQEIKDVHTERKSYQLAMIEQIAKCRNEITKLMVCSQILKEHIQESKSINEKLDYIPNKINDDFLRIAEETWRLHNRITQMEIKARITQMEIKAHIAQPELLNKTYNDKRSDLGLEPIESCDTNYIDGVEILDDEEVFK